MSWWPWVSRARLEDAQQEIAELKAERQRLHDRLAVLRGEQPLFERPVTPPPVPTVETPQRVSREEVSSEKKYVAGSVTPEYVRAEAAKALREGTLGQVTRIR